GRLRAGAGAPAARRGDRRRRLRPAGGARPAALPDRRLRRAPRGGPLGPGRRAGRARPDAEARVRPGPVRRGAGDPRRGRLARGRLRRAPGRLRRRLLMDRPAFFDGAAVERLLDPTALLDRLAAAFVDLSRGTVVAPRRIQLDVPKGFSLSMPAYRPGGPFAVKIVNVFEENRALGVPSHQAVVCVFDEDTGRCTAVLDGAAVTAARTAGAAALSAGPLPPPGATVPADRG